MNYCYNCGAKIIEKDQKFCVECGINLQEHDQKYKDYLRKSHSKYNPKEGESYNDYLNRIGSPMKDTMATEKEMENESIAYRDYDPLKDYKRNHPKINYPKEEMQAEPAIAVELEDEHKKEVIVEGMYGKPALSREGNYIVEGMYGRPKYYIDGDIIRENNQFGRPIYHIDGNYIREGMYGKPKYYIDGDLIKENNQFGRVVGRKRKF